MNNDNDSDATISGIVAGSDYPIEIAGAAGNDTLSANGGLATGAPWGKQVYIMGGAGIDTLTGGSANDYMWGDSNDSFPFDPPPSAGNDTLRGGDGGDNLYGETGNDVVEGGAGGDNIGLEAGLDRYRGGDGSDYFRDETNTSAADGADPEISGGRGTDYLDLSDRAAALTITLDNVANDGQDTAAATNEGDNVMADIETFDLGNGNDIFNANVAPAATMEVRRTVYGELGNDTLTGRRWRRQPPRLQRERHPQRRQRRRLAGRRRGRRQRHRR